jgi:hypothetical protein
MTSNSSCTGIWGCRLLAGSLMLPLTSHVWLCRAVHEWGLLVAFSGGCAPCRCTTAAGPTLHPTQQHELTLTPPASPPAPFLAPPAGVRGHGCC